MGRRLNGFRILSMNDDGTILFLVMLLDKTVSQSDKTVLGRSPDVVRRKNCCGRDSHRNLNPLRYDAAESVCDGTGATDRRADGRRTTQERTSSSESFISLLRRVDVVG